MFWNVKTRHSGEGRNPYRAAGASLRAWIPAFAGMTLLWAASAQAQVTLSNDKPVEISSDALDVQQDKHQAIFKGNVIATQGGMNMRSDVMTVHYAQDAQKTEASSATGGAQGISRIDADGNVIFTNGTDTAKGEHAIYQVTTETLELTGNVLLTRDKNILKGTKLTYDLKTGRSILTAGGATVSDGKTGGGGRVHGLFVPGADKK